MDHSFLNAAMERIFQEATRIAATRPHCHLTQNDMMAIALLHRIHQEEPIENLAMVEACLERMRIADTCGIYPRHMVHRTTPLR